MTATPARLGRRQVDVLRAAAGELGVDNGTYGALSQAMRDQPPTT